MSFLSYKVKIYVFFKEKVKIYVGDFRKELSARLPGIVRVL